MGADFTPKDHSLRSLRLACLALVSPKSLVDEEISENRRRGPTFGVDERARQLSLRKARALRSGWLRSFGWMAYAAIVGTLVGRSAFQELGIRPTPIIVAGAAGGLILLWATIALRGWDVQTMIGDTLIERLNRFVFKVACVVGTILAVTSASWGIGSYQVKDEGAQHRIVIEREAAVEQSVGEGNRAMGGTTATLQVLIAIGVGVIAYMQWRTAHQKVLIDLFERRVKVYDKVNDAVRFYLTSEGNLKTFSARVKLSEAWSESRFLFGQEVTDAISALRDQIASHSRKETRLANPNLGEGIRERTAAELEQVSNDLDNWREPFARVCLPYLRMDQKRVRTPIEWFHDQNRKRLSYGEPPRAEGNAVQDQEELGQQAPAGQKAAEG